MHKSYKSFGSSYEEICGHLMCYYSCSWQNWQLKQIMSTHLFAKNVYYHPTLPPVGSIYSHAIAGVKHR